MEIKLPPAFQFSQSSLQDYVDCSRRFQLRYLLQQDWPAPVAEPMQDAERADILGKRFHLLMERYWLGLPAETVDAALLDWWQAFQHTPPPGLPEKGPNSTLIKPEITTTARIHNQRMTATFDLLYYQPNGGATIIDWKTSRHKPSRNVLDHRLQTIIYPLLLVESSERLVGYKLAPEAVRLVYWFANAPTQVEVFQYSTARYEQDQRYLAGLLDQLLTTKSKIWPLTEQTQRCRLCQYRSLCARGHRAGSLDEAYDDQYLEEELIILDSYNNDDANDSEYVL